MERRKPLKRILSFMMAFLMVLGVINASMFTALAGTAWYTNEYLDINYRGTSGLISYGGGTGNLWRPSRIEWYNADRDKPYTGYCVNPIWAGIEDVATEYAFDIMAFDSTTTVNTGDKNATSTSTAGNNLANALAGVIVHGFPARSAKDVLGMENPGIDERDFEWAAYVATKYAGWAMVRDQYSNMDNWDVISGGGGYSTELRKATLDAMKEIYVFASTYVPPTGTDLTISVGSARENGTFLEIPCTLNGGSMPDGSKYLVRGASALAIPAGATIVNESGAEYPKITIGGLSQYEIPASDTTIYIKYPIPETKPYDVTLNLEVYAERGEPPILVYAQAKVDNRQSYIMAGTGYDNVPFNVTFGEGDQQDPATKETGGSGKLKVVKLDAKDGTPISSVTFDVYNSSGQLIDTGTTNASGTWIPNVTEDGTYTVVERSTNTNYQLTEPTTLVVTIQSDSEATATFRDFKLQDVEVIKEDATTGAPVAGCEYEIVQIDGRGAWRAVGTTDSKGSITWSDVPDGTYMVREVSTTSGYILDQTPQYVTVRNGMAPSLKFLDSKFPGLTIEKRDGQTGLTITGSATFRVEQIDGSYSEDVTASGGTVNLQNLPVGSYKITELSAPNGYVIDTESTTVYLGAGESRQVIFLNLKNPVLTIEKVDAISGNPVPGTRFEIRKTDGTLYGTVETGANGRVVVGAAGFELGYLEPGTYTVTEVFVPHPYVLSGEHQDIVLNGGDLKSLFFGNLEMPQILIEKYDEQTGEKLADAQFAIYEQEDAARPVVEGMTDRNGQLDSGYIKPGTYVVKELNPPPGYMFSDKTTSQRTIVAKAGDGAITVKFDNIKLPQLTIKKVDAITGEPISGVTYRVEATDSTSFQPATVTTGANGTSIIPGLAADVYTVTEIHCPSRYILDTTPQTVRMEGGDEKTLLFQNTLYPTLIIEKINYETYLPVANTTFKIEYENLGGGTELVGTYRTDDNGRIILPYVKAGWYVITETIPAQGMQTPSNPITRIYLSAGTNSYTDTSSGTIGGNGSVTISSGLDYPVVAGIVNYPKHSIVIKKSDAVTGEMLAGAVFEVMKITGGESGQDGTTVATCTTDVSGVIVVEGLEAGGYAIREIKAPPNYLISETALQTANLKADGTSIVEILFNNYPYGGISIDKIDGSTGSPLPGAAFKVTDASGAMLGDNSYTTDGQGNILIPNVKPGSYVITELSAPDGYAIDTTPQTVLVGTDGKIYKVSFINYPEGTLVISKYDSATKAPLAGAVFKVTDSTGAVVGTGNGEYITNASGTITIPSLPKGSYTVTEIKPPDGYSISQGATQTIAVDYSKTYSLDFYNTKLSSLQIVKIDADTKQPLKDAEFIIYKQSGEVVGKYTTDGDGLIIIDELADGWYKAVETKSPSGYIIDTTPIDFEMKGNQFLKLTFENKKLTSLVIKKVDDNTGEPLRGAVFYVERQNGVHVGEYTTDNDGLINIPTLMPDWYIVRETESPDGYLLEESPKTVEVKTVTPTVVTFTNEKLTSLQIRKVDESTGEPLGGAKFAVERQNGERVGEYTTDHTGLINIPALEPDWYIVRETFAPLGYLLDESPKTVEVKTTAPTVITFTNKKLTSLQIKKIDEVTGSALPGAQFTVEKQNGESIYTNENGTIFATDSQGLINIPTLEPDYYIVREVKAPEGYIIDEMPKTVQVKTDSPTVVTFTNAPLGGLKIVKINSETKAPIAGVEFEIAKMNGEKVQNGSNTYRFVTDSTGQIYMPGLSAGYYVVTETKAANGYFIDAEPKTVEVKAGTPTVLEVQNKPAAGLLIIKTDMQTGKPLQGVVFDIENADRRRVQGSILDGNQVNTENNSPNRTTSQNGFVAGSYTTDYRGRIQINNLAPGVYSVIERKALSGYELDTEIYSVTVTPGKQAVLELANKPLSGLRLKKVDSITGEPIFNTEFMVFDNNNKVVGTFYTDNQGLIDFSAILVEGRYTILETRASEGYYLDSVPRTVEFVAGKVTEIEWKNTPCMGQIQITKLSDDDNQVNGLPAGTPLENAIFEVYSYKSGSLVDRFVTASNGKGVSKPLPLGRYTVKEVQAPAYYQLNNKELDITLEFATQIIKLEYTNRSANTGVTIRKTGNIEAMPGDLIRYDIKAVRNDSTIPLSDFYWRDVLPADAVRLNKIVTGTYNQALRYKVMAATNKGNSIIIADNLSTTVNNLIDCSNVSLGLSGDEFVTSFTLLFGSVKAGFTCVQTPHIYVDVLKELPNGYQFSNKCDVGGKTGTEWVISDSRWVVSVYRGTNAKLPKTGY